MTLLETFSSNSVNLGSFTNSRPECIIASNRGPIEYFVDNDGTYKMREGPGGLVTTLLNAIQYRRVVWVALAISEIDWLGVRTKQDIAGCLQPAFADLTLHLLSVPQDAYESYYKRICKEVLWPAQHFLLDHATCAAFTQQTRKNWEQGYCVINEAVASAIIGELKERGSDIPVIIQDYQLYLVAGLIREHCPNARLSHIVHIPWPEARYMALLPQYMIQAIYHSMAMNDIIGFQTGHDARNFLTGAASVLNDVQVVWNESNRQGTMYWRGRSIHVCVYPAMLKASYILTLVQSHEAEVASREVRTLLGMDEKGQLILRVDRIEPSKNIISGFQAYDRLLTAHPELYRRVTFLASLIPTCESLSCYRSYERQVRDIIADINARHGLQEWQPIVAVFGNNRARTLEYYQDYDVLLVNPIIDGMNLVVKEGGLLNNRSGVIILSQSAGAYDALCDHVLPIAPLDIEATAEALFQALSMPDAERVLRANMIREILLQEDAAALFDMQIKTLSSI